MRIMGMVVMMVEDAADEIRGWDDNDGGDDNDEDGGDDDHDVPTYKGGWCRPCDATQVKHCSPCRFYNQPSISVASAEVSVL